MSTVSPKLSVTCIDEPHHIHNPIRTFDISKHPVVRDAVSNVQQESMQEALAKAKSELAEFQSVLAAGEELDEDGMRRLKELSDRALYLTAASARNLKDTPMGRYVERKRKATVKEQARKDRASASKPTKADRKAEKKRRKQKQRSAKK